MASPNNYGVQPSGFIRPTLADLIQEEKDIMLLGWPSLTFAAGSPELAIVEARAKAEDQKWQQLECVYQSFNPCNAEGCALDDRAAIFGIVRQVGEKDAELRRRVKSGTAQGCGFETALQTKLENITGVELVRIYNNTTGGVDAITGNVSGSYEVVIQGGDDTEIAEAIWECSTGATQLGNTSVQITDKSGICRFVRFTRPTETPMCIKLHLTTYDTSCGCDGQNMEAIIDAVYASLTDTGTCTRNIGDTIYASSITGPLYAAIKGIDVRRVEFSPSIIAANGDCSCDEDAFVEGALNLGPRTIPVFDRDCICISALET